MAPHIRYARIVTVPRRAAWCCQDGVFPEQATPAHFERAYRFLDGGLEGAVYRHHLAGGLHLRAENPVATGELVEWPARNLDHDVVQRRLEGGCCLAGDGIGYLVERLTNGDFSRYPCNRIAGGLRGQCRGARNARIDLDHPGRRTSGDSAQTGCCSRPRYPALG